MDGVFLGHMYAACCYVVFLFLALADGDLARRSSIQDDQIACIRDHLSYSSPGRTLLSAPLACRSYLLCSSARGRPPTIAFRDL